MCYLSDIFLNLSSGFMLGLASNISCFATCAPVILPYFISSNEKPLGTITKYLSGRLLSYMAFAVLSGFTGVYLTTILNTKVFGTLSIVLSVWLIIFAINGLKNKERICPNRILKYVPSNSLPFLAGLVMGLNLCPPLLLAFNYAVQMADFFRPLLFFMGFFAGSSLWLIILFFGGKLNGRKEVRLIGFVASILAGIWYFWKGIGALTGTL